MIKVAEKPFLTVEVFGATVNKARQKGAEDTSGVQAVSREFGTQVEGLFPEMPEASPEWA